MKKVLIALADEGYVNQAKQLFSGAFFHGGWDGDLMLLSVGVPTAALDWFRSRGILVKEMPAPQAAGATRYGEILRTKLMIFSPEFRDWDNIVYLDSDIVVRRSIAPLGRVRGFAAVADCAHNLADQLIDPARAAPDQRTLIAQLGACYDVDQSSFNAGVLAFSTSALRPDDSFRLLELSQRYESVATYAGGEQLALNLVFKDRWQHLPLTYNVQPRAVMPLDARHPNRLRAAVLHFAGPLVDKPWDPHSPFHTEWLGNLRRADTIRPGHTSGRPGAPLCGPIIDSWALQLRFQAFHQRRHLVRAYRRAWSAALTAGTLMARSRFPAVYTALRTLKHRLMR
jgi:hypothetical protein